MLVTIGVDPRVAGRIAGRLAVEVHGPAAPEAALRSAARPGVAGVVLGARVADPLTLGWRLAAVGGPPVLVLAHGVEVDRLEQALRDTPLPHRVAQVRASEDAPWSPPERRSAELAGPWSVHADSAEPRALLDPEGRVLAWNGAAAVGTGVEERMALGTGLVGWGLRAAELPAPGLERARVVRLARADGVVSTVDAYRAAFHAVGLGLVVLERDPAGDLRVRVANPAVRRLSGGTAEVDTGERLENWAPALVESLHVERLHAAFGSDRVIDLGILELAADPASGTGHRWLGVRALPLGADLVALTLEDLTAVGSANAAVREHERFVDSIVENLPSMIFVKDARELRFVRFNRAGERLLGYDRADLLGRNDRDFFPKEEADFFIEKDRAVLASGTALDIPEEPIHTRAGVRWLHTQKLPLLDAEGVPRFLLGISQDVTETRLARDQLARQAEELRRSNAELEQFASVAAHELRGPLQVISLYAEVVQLELGAAAGPEGTKAAAGIVQAVGRLRELLDDLLTYARVSSISRLAEPVDLAATVRTVLEDLQSGARERRATIEVGELPEVLGNPTQLVQLFRNLLENAFRFGGEPPRVELRSERVGDRHELHVRDHGPGIAPEHQEAVFRMFFRVRPSETEGTGIGLALCRRIVECHGGTITVRRAPGGGADFCFTLPAVPDDPDPSA